jgi:hypothetical protein
MITWIRIVSEETLEMLRMHIRKYTEDWELNN